MKIEDVIKDLQNQIRNTREWKMAEGATSWERQLGILISINDAQALVDALTISAEDNSHKLNGTIVEDEIMGQSITQPEWHLDPMELPATKGDVSNTIRLVVVSINNLSARLQTIERKML